jgi:hypothetical protein
MPTSLLYQWENEIASHFPGLNSWQQSNLALFSYGVMRAKSCQQRAVSVQLAEELGAAGASWESYERRLQRFIANPACRVSAACRAWLGWVWQALGSPAQWTVLVDETKLSDHLSIMLLGVAYEQRCIPLVWQCYTPEQYPRCGQVGLVMNLLMHVKKALPAHLDCLVLVDRGIGTSPRLCQLVDEVLNWRYLFRVTCQTKIVTAAGDYTIARQVQPGEVWCASGRIFKKRGKLPGHARAIWTIGYDDPWALVTNDPHLSGFEYARRNWQEQSFKDLKSAGWQWGQSQVWLPDHARRLLLVLAVAYGWTLALGAHVFRTCQQARPKVFADGRRERRYSLFTEGWLYFCAMIVQPHRAQVHLWFAALEPPP